MVLENSQLNQKTLQQDRELLDTNDANDLHPRPYQNFLSANKEQEIKVGELEIAQADKILHTEVKLNEQALGNFEISEN